jgi:hypothetical protein
MGTHILWRKVFLILVLAGFSLGYMEWGSNQHSFIFETQMLIFSQPEKMVSNFTHPIILAGLLGQLILLAALLGFPVRRYLLALALGLLAIPILLIFLAGALSQNLAMMCSCIPFLAGSLGLGRGLFPWRRH